MNSKTKTLTYGAVIAALYVALTMLSNLLGLANGAVQLRLSEVLTILPAFTASAIPGLAVGCLLSNLLTGCALWDVVFGTIATLLGAIGTSWIGRNNKFLAAIPPILSNAIIIPFVLQKVYGVEDGFWYLFATVGLGEILSCGVLGCLLYTVLKKRNPFS